MVESGFAPAALIVSILAYCMPAGFVWMKPHIPLLLGAIMFGMGMTLTMADFVRVARRPRLLLAGTAAQFLVMPLLGYLIGVLLGLPPQMTAGVVLLGACPGGTASNVISFLARADVGLSVSLTLVSTLLAPLMTPWLTWFYVHQTVNVDVIKLMGEVCYIVLIPVLGGLAVKTFLQGRVRTAMEWFPLVSTVIIVLVIGCVVGLNQKNIREMSMWVALAVALHNGGGLAMGYFAGWIVGADSAARRTLAIEVGMQNSGLAVALSLNSAAFGPLAALPAALFSLWHNITGAILASSWSRSADVSSYRG